MDFQNSGGKLDTAIGDPSPGNGLQVRPLSSRGCITRSPIAVASFVLTVVVGGGDGGGRVGICPNFLT
uniref:Uncharacterized protein n=1 Tax=Trichuris muris TaxID=70415 RepID=A0A5S6QSE7_TRIMR